MISESAARVAAILLGVDEGVLPDLEMRSGWTCRTMVSSCPPNVRAPVTVGDETRIG